MSSFLRDIESNTTFLAQPLFGVDFGSKEARFAAAMVAAGVSGGGGGSTSPADIAAGMDLSVDLQVIADAVTGQNANTLVDLAFTATTSSQVAYAANAQNKETYIQNLSLTETIFIRNNGAPTTALGIMLLPGGSHIFSGFEATLELQIIARANTAPVYIKQVR